MDNTTHLKARITALSLLLLPAAALATTINFNDGSPGQPIASFYASQGITFGNASWQPAAANQAGTPSEGPVLADIGDSGFNPPYSPTAATPIVGVFSSPMASLSVLAVDVGSAGVRLDAYDAAVAGNRIATDVFFGVGGGVGAFHVLSVLVPGMLRFELYQPNPTVGDGVAFDNLNFAPVPEPAAALLLATGLALALGQARGAGGKSGARVPLSS